MSTFLELMKARRAEVEATVPKSELAAPDKSHGKFFSMPGIFEVTASGLQDIPKKAGGTWRGLPIKDDEGREKNLFIFLLDKDKNPSPIKMQQLLKGFGFSWNQKVISLFWDIFEPALASLCVGRVVAQLSYYGFVPWYEEKGLYIIRDFSKGAPPFPDNKVVDPINGDVYAGGSKEEVQKLMVDLKMKEGGENWEILRPAPGFVMTEEQAQACEIIEGMISEGPAKQPEPEPEKPKPTKPAFMLKK